MSTFTINDLPFHERPRERLIRHGVSALSIYELLQIVLGRGVANRSVMQIAQELLAKFGSLKGIAEADITELSSVVGMGQAKSCQLLAAFELSRRLDMEPLGKITIQSAGDAARVLMPILSLHQKEHFVLLCLDARFQLLSAKNISIGTVSSSLVHPREVFREAIRACASSVIVSHNHPSGNAEPSEQDIEITKRLRHAGELVGIEVRDHIIIAGRNFISMKERKMMG